MYEDLDLLVSTTIRDSTVVDAFLSCDSEIAGTTVNFLIAVSTLLHPSMSLLKPLESLPPSISRADFLAMFKKGMQDDLALAEWREKLLPALL